MLAPEFTGRWYEKPGGGYFHTWSREQHKANWTRNRGKGTDTIHEMVAEGEWVAVRFTRDMEWKGRRVKVPMMQFMQFVGGKIALIWEYGPTSELTADSKLL